MLKQLLQDLAIKAAKPKDKDYRLNDGDGLFLLIKTTGAKWCRFDGIQPNKINIHLILNNQQRL